MAMIFAYTPRFVFGMIIWMLPRASRTAVPKSALCSNVVTTRSSVERVKPFSIRMLRTEISGAFWISACSSGVSAPRFVASSSGSVAMPASWNSAM